MPPSDLSKAITSEQWDRVLDLCAVKPESAKVWSVRQGLFEGIKDSNVLPLHEALVAGAPYAIIAALLTAHPAAISIKESSYRRLPLHCACRRNATRQVVDLLLASNGEAALIADTLGRLPLHYALSNGANDKVIDALLKTQPDSARGLDKRGWTPLHVACGVGASTHVIKSLLRCYPEAVLTRTHKGSTAQQCLNLTAAQNKEEVSRLLRKYYNKVEYKYRMPTASQKAASMSILV